MHLTKVYFTGPLLKSKTAVKQRFYNDAQPGRRVLAEMHLPTSPWPFIRFQMSPAVWARHLVRHLLQHFPFLPGSKFKPRGLVPSSLFMCRLECGDPTPLPHSYKCVFWVYSLNFAPTDCHLVLVLHFFFFFYPSLGKTQLLQPTCQAAMEAQTSFSLWGVQQNSSRPPGVVEELQCWSTCELIGEARHKV